MNKVSLVAAAFLFFFVFAVSAAVAHPASKIEIGVDGENVNLIINHEVDDAQKHYIKKIEVYINNKKMIEQRELRQTDSHSQLAVYKVPGLKPGDTVRVKAECSTGAVKNETKII